MPRSDPKPADAPGTDTGSRKRVGRPRRDGRPAITRQDILRSAARLFAERGFAATSIKTISDDLSCHGTSIFNHFSTKEAILDELIEVTFGNEFGLFNTLTSIDAAPEVVLHRLIFEDALACIGEEVTIRKIFLLPELRTDRFEAARRYWNKNTAIYAGLIERARAAGRFVVASPEQAAEAVYTLCTTGLISLSHGKFGSSTEYAKTLADLALRALLAEPDELGRIRVASAALLVDWQPHKL